MEPETGVPTALGITATDKPEPFIVMIVGAGTIGATYGTDGGGTTTGGVGGIGSGALLLFTPPDVREEIEISGLEADVNV
jgi:hypothetical protein